MSLRYFFTPILSCLIMGLFLAGCFIFPPNEFKSPTHSLTKACFSPDCIISETCALFDNARDSIYISMYHLEHPLIIECLNRNTSRPLDIQIATDLSHSNSPALASLVLKNVKLFAGNEKGLMHNKYLIIDRHLVMTGSANLSLSLESSRNLMLTFDSFSLASYFLKDFTAYQHYEFGKVKSLPTNTALSHILNQEDIVVFFTPYSAGYSDFYTGYPFLSLDKLISPLYIDLLELNSSGNYAANGLLEQGIDLDNDQVPDLYLKDRMLNAELQSPSAVIYQLGNSNAEISAQSNTALNALMYYLLQTKHSIVLAAYSLTEPTIIKSLQNLYTDKEISLSIFLDYQQAKTMSGESLLNLKNLQRSCKCVRMFQEQEITMHHKFILMDNQLLLTGSLNYSKNAFEVNDESFLLWKNASIITPFLHKEIQYLLENSFSLDVEDIP